MRLLSLVSLFFFIMGGQQLLAVDWQDDPAVAKVMAESGVNGTFVLLDVQKKQFSGFDRSRAETRYVPASTFKIPNSVIALVTGAVKDVDEKLPWDGQPKYLKSWEKDMGLREAIKVSNVPVYQQVARRVGLAKMAEMVTSFNYGNHDIGQSVDTFWLDGPLKISAVEQCEFLAKLAQGQLPVPEDAQKIVGEITVIDSSSFGVLHGKTGTTSRQSPQWIGWWVGWVDSPDGLKVFALNLDLTEEKSGPDYRIELGRACLKAAGVL